MRFAFGKDAVKKSWDTFLQHQQALNQTCRFHSHPCTNGTFAFGCSQWFRSAVIKENAMPEGLMTLLFSNIDPIYEFHRGFLKELDQRLALW